ncbi:uncharacterized protein MONBRDRAFT_29043 [Monosiga brevicollis MX1]|uniref:UBX domain-containing protein n=1 Tax=Monosiga brevicollis TaxID=81824 RepID=A9V9Y3_MONBE|nr:uncharacterized protein MONBRDRAFT_29043 [Monosiga brevicollis MX1]EDQ85566.1 predicted protein [Monosiga brevicollis MX1]|eukprot:XP_001749515.1 hypothetical protein [Monosiga brevicollis MX1]
MQRHNEAWLASHRIASHRIASHRIASHRIASHRIASHRIASQQTHLHLMRIFLPKRSLHTTSIILSGRLRRRKARRRAGPDSPSYHEHQRIKCRTNTLIPDLYLVIYYLNLFIIITKTEATNSHVNVFYLSQALSLSLKLSNSQALKLSLSLCQALSSSVKLSLSLSLSLSSSLSHKQALSLSQALSLKLSNSQALSLKNSLSSSLSLLISLSLSLELLRQWQNQLSVSGYSPTRGFVPLALVLVALFKMASEEHVQFLQDLSGLPEEQCRSILADNGNDLQVPRLLQGQAAKVFSGPGICQQAFAADTPPSQTQGAESLPELLLRMALGPVRFAKDVMVVIFRLLAAFFGTLLPGFDLSRLGFAAPGPSRTVQEDLRARHPDLSFPMMLEGSFQEASRQSRSDIKFLLIYLHAEQHQDVDAFARTILASDALRTLVEERCVMYAANLNSREGHAVAVQVRALAFPCLAVCLHTDGALQLLHTQQGLADPDRVMGALLQTLDRYEPVLIAARADRMEVQQSQAIREEQDLAYQQSLLEDQRKSEERRLEQERAEQEAAEAAAAEAKQAQATQDRHARLAALKANFPAEPVKGDGVIKVAIQLPQRRVHRLFRTSDPTSLIYDFVDCQDELESSQFGLFTTQPKRRIANDQQTLAEQDLTRNVLLLCHEEGEDEEEA